MSTHPIVRSSNCQIIQLFNNPIVKKSNCPIIQLSNNPIVQSSNCPIIKLSINPIVQTSNCPIIQLSNHPIVQLSNYTIIQLYNFIYFRWKRIENSFRPIPNHSKIPGLRIFTFQNSSLHSLIYFTNDFKSKIIRYSSKPDNTP